MNHFETILFFSKKYLNFLITDYGFELTEKHLAKEYYITLKNKKTEIELISELGNLTLPIVTFKCYGMNFDIKKLSHSSELIQLISENHKRTMPIMEKLVSNYLKTKVYDQEKWSYEFENNVRKEIETQMSEIQKILINNTKILKGNFLPFIFKKPVANKELS